MKSIIEEASSIAKAIENGWIKAGKPQEFSIKIFEEPEKNFFGMVKRSAKVGIFYKDNQPKQEQAKPKSSFKSPARQFTQTKQSDAIVKSTEDRSEKNLTKNSEKVLSEKNQEQVIWTPEMITHVNTWLKQVLEIIESPAQISISAERFHLKVQFDQPLFIDKTQEKQFFSGLSILLFQILKITYRRPLKGFKIIFSTIDLEPSIG